MWLLTVAVTVDINVVIDNFTIAAAVGTGGGGRGGWLATCQGPPRNIDTSGSEYHTITIMSDMTGVRPQTD
jgi:hypothetical protein